MKKTAKAAPRRGRPAIITSSDAAMWLSCRIITPNLVAAYRQLFGDNADYFSYSREMELQDRIQRQFNFLEIAERIFEAKPDRLVFLDHQPHPVQVLVALAALYGSRPLPPIYIHVFGDFTLFMPQWWQLVPILKKSRVKFICASAKQAGMISQFMVDAEKVVTTSPFPVDRTVYFSDRGLRAQWRSRLGISEGERALIYTGRLSLQKNSHLLLTQIARHLLQSEVPTQFFIAGRFDDLGAPHFGVHTEPGAYYQQWRRTLKSLPAPVRARTHYLGQLEASDLRGVYNASDTFVSLSMHHDEDYGMSPAEALSCGASAVLTDWGGYSSFKGTDWSCDLASVAITDTVPRIDLDSFQKKLREHVSGTDQSPEAREARSQAFLDRFSIEAARGLLQAIQTGQPAHFKGFNWLAERFDEALKGYPLFPNRIGRGTFYEEIYGVYAQKTV